MATLTPKRYVISEVKRCLEAISVANSYSTNVATVRTDIFGRDDVRSIGSLPAVGFIAGRSVPTYDSFSEMRIVMPVTVTCAVAASVWLTALEALDKLEDDVIAALMRGPVLDNSLIGIHYRGSEDDIGSPDTFDSQGGTMSMVMFFEAVYRRSSAKAIS